jgi:hypothetical protein
MSLFNPFLKCVIVPCNLLIGSMIAVSNDGFVSIMGGILLSSLIVGGGGVVLAVVEEEEKDRRRGWWGCK